MKTNYIIKYSWSGIWNKQDRIFSTLNIISVTVTMSIMIGLTGLLYAFKNFSENVLKTYPLRIEIFKSKDTLLSDLKSMEKEILALKGCKSVYKRVPTFISFFDAGGNIVSAKKGARGSTTQAKEPFTLKDIFEKKIQFLGKKQLGQPFDEAGIIVTVKFLEKLGFIESNTTISKIKNIKKSLPDKVKIQITELDDANNPINRELEIPIIGIVFELERGDYIITEDFYNILLQWKEPFKYMIKKRDGSPLSKMKEEVREAYYQIKENHLAWFEENYDFLDSFKEFGLEVFTTTWEGPNGLFEERLVIKGTGVLNTKILNYLDKTLRRSPVLQTLPPMKTIKNKAKIRSWNEFPLLPSRHQYMQAAVYVKERQYVRPILEQLRSKGLFARSKLERELARFEKRERFFVGASIAILGMILFFAGVVLFSTFYTSILRKRKEVGIFKAYGASNPLVLVIIYTQATMIAFMGNALGILIGIQVGNIFCSWINTFSNLAKINLVFSIPFHFVFILVAIVFFFCYIAIYIPSKIAIDIDPAQVVRG